MPSIVTVHYRFHPLYGHELRVVRWCRPGNRGATVEHPDGNTLKVPLWILEPAADRYHLSETIELDGNALTALMHGSYGEPGKYTGEITSCQRSRYLMAANATTNSW
jgi:hypothetical protein